MKVSRDSVVKHRSAILKAASRLYREHGYDRVSVVQISKQAGLTHGGFYGHFDSKEALGAAATDQATSECLNALTEFCEGNQGDLGSFIDFYLSEQHRDNPGEGCPLVSLGVDASRQGEVIQQAFATSVNTIIDTLSKSLAVGNAREVTTLLMSTLIGGMLLARGTAQTQPEFSSEILKTLSQQLHKLLPHITEQTN